jgi:hypothetical protein
VETHVASASSSRCASNHIHFLCESGRNLVEWESKSERAYRRSSHWLRNIAIDRQEDDDYDMRLRQHDAYSAMLRRGNEDLMDSWNRLLEAQSELFSSWRKSSGNMDGRESHSESISHRHRLLTRHRINIDREERERRKQRFDGTRA